MLFVTAVFLLSAADLYPQININNYPDLSSAVSGESKNIIFTIDTVKSQSALSAVSCAGPATLYGGGVYKIFNFTVYEIRGRHSRNLQTGIWHKNKRKQKNGRYLHKGLSRESANLDRPLGHNASVSVPDSASRLLILRL